MRRNGHKTTSGVKFDLKWLLWARFRIWREILEIGPQFRVFLTNFLQRMRRNAHKTTSGQIFLPKIWNRHGLFLFDYEFWWRLLQDMCLFQWKTAFVMQNFRNLGASGVGSPYLTKPSKGKSLADFTHFEPWPLCVQIRSGVFPLREPTKKRNTKKSHRDVIFHLFAGNSPLNQI